MHSLSHLNYFVNKSNRITIDNISHWVYHSNVRLNDIVYEYKETPKNRNIGTAITNSGRSESFKNALPYFQKKTYMCF